MKRPVLIACLGYCFGIILGVYANWCMLPFFILILSFYYYLLHANNKKVRRYSKILFRKSMLFLFLISLFLANKVTVNLNESYQNCYESLKEVIATSMIIGDGKENEYGVSYPIKIIDGNRKELKNHHFYLLLKKEKEKNSKYLYGDILKIKGNYQKPSSARNENGFDQSLYLKSKQIYGSIKVEEVPERIKEQRPKNFLGRVQQIRISIIGKVQELLPGEEGNLLIGILLGKKEYLSDKTIDYFRESSLSHMLAVSGAHISYLVLGLTFFLEKSKLPKRLSYFLTIIGLLFFMFLADFTPSVVRATLMGCFVLISKILFRRNDGLTSLSFSFLIILLNNPFSLYDLGLQLSYGAVVGIFLFYQPILNQLRLKKEAKEKVCLKIFLKNQLINKMKQLIGISLSAQMILIPIIMLQFYTVSFTFLISNLLASPILGICMIMGIIMLIGSFCFPILSIGLSRILAPLLKALLMISQYSSYLPLSNINTKRPKTVTVIVYFLALIALLLFYHLKNKKYKLQREKRWLICIQKSIKKVNHMIIILIIIVFVIVSCMDIHYKKELEISFIDVGQGDCTFITSQTGKTILIDGGGSYNPDRYDVGKSILIPYFLAKRIKQIDYIMVSHFDSDHCQGLLTIMEELKVKNVIIAKQFETCENYEEFKNIVKEKKIKVHVVDAGRRIKIEKNLYFDVLWPSSGHVIQENSINNNSLVCKLVYKDFSMLFTGDIEEIAEKAILNKYKDTNILQSTILKVAHHGSKSSSIEGFLNAVKPKIAVIGVGENNTFGHPNQGVIERLGNLRL